MTLPLEYEDIRHIDEVQPIDYSDQDCIDEVQEVLKRRGKLDRFGMSLLHTHFPMSSDETLLETCDPVSRVLTTKPVKKSALGKRTTIQTTWRFDGRAGRECVWDNEEARHISGGH